MGSALNTNPAGTVHAYARWGETLPGWGTRLNWDNDPMNYGYTGSQFDAESEQYYYRSRTYDLIIGRLLSKDPLLFQGEDTNLYGYVMQDAINRTDPNGLASCTYAVSSHTLVCVSFLGDTYHSTNVFSGHGGFLNDPSAASIPFLGPIPQGVYNIGQKYLEHGFPRSNLSPFDPNSTFGRSAFEVHGCSNQTMCSSGCLGVYGNSNLSSLENLLDTDSSLGQQNTLTVLP